MRQSRLLHSRTLAPSDSIAERVAQSLEMITAQQIINTRKTLATKKKKANFLTRNIDVVNNVKCQTHVSSPVGNHALYYIT